MRASRQVAYALRSPMLAAYVDSLMARRGALPLPTDPPHVRAMGADPDRLLMIGTAPVQGVGVASYDLALGGQLARRISSFTGRGVDLDLVGRQTMTAADATEIVKSADLARYDGLILMVGAREAMGLQPRTMWRRDLGALLDAVAEHAPATMTTFLIEVPHLSRILALPSALGMAVDGGADRINDVTQQLVAARPLTQVVPFASSTLPAGARFGSVATYEHWADRIAPSIADSLLDPPSGPRRPEPVDEEARQRALDELHILDTPPDERFDRIVRMARDGLGMAGAAINFIDHNRQWTKASASLGEPGNARRMDALCDATIRRPELLVVEDLRSDLRFAHLPSVAGELGLRFYAGYPVESPDGQRVGTLCVVDFTPRRLDAAESAMLRELALRTQDLVWALAG